MKYFCCCCFCYCCCCCCYYYCFFSFFFFVFLGNCITKLLSHGVVAWTGSSLSPAQVFGHLVPIWWQCLRLLAGAVLVEEASHWSGWRVLNLMPLPLTTLFQMWDPRLLFLHFCSLLSCLPVTRTLSPLQLHVQIAALPTSCFWSRCLLQQKKWPTRRTVSFSQSGKERKNTLPAPFPFWWFWAEDSRYS